MKNIIAICFFTFLTNNCFSQAAKLEWAKNIANIGYGYGAGYPLGIVLDDSGNVYEAGSFGDTVDFDPGPGVFLMDTSKGSLYITKLNAAGNFVWAKSFGTGYPSGFAIDKHANLLLTGEFSVTADFDPGAGIQNLITNHTYTGFVLKMDRSGNFAWAKKFDGDYKHGSVCRPRGITADDSDNIYSLGPFSGPVDFDPDTSEFIPSIIGGGYLSKLSKDGKLVWAKVVAEGAKYTSGTTISFSKNGFLYTGGVYNGTVDFDPGAGIFNLSGTASTANGFISKLTRNGSFVWAKAMVSNILVHPIKLVVDNEDNVYTAGRYEGKADFDPAGAKIYNLESVGYNSAFILKLDSTGTFKWARSTGRSKGVQTTDIALDKDQNSYVVGNFQDSIDINTDSLVEEMVKDKEAFIIKLNKNGAYQWNLRFGGGGLESFRGVALDHARNIHLVGMFGTKVDFDPDTSIYFVEGGKVTAKYSQVSPLFVQAVNQVSQAKIFPNPTYGAFIIEWPNSITAVSGKVFNILGSEILSFESIEKRVEIDISNQASGLYFLQLQNSDGKIVTTRIMKQ